ncbi:hypothetical protein AXFE_14300 [Acidithrix ferrooxidans]|uniref:Uncharacterized protein n=1 Tax=Acidithrix ferrooxidans TaxID=1280514 RepID=A0A0D8HIW0_9ACTN|nr:hypothetical protein AXFE_14300 [Acidithrix ferrooxidans]
MNPVIAFRSGNPSADWLCSEIDERDSSEIVIDSYGYSFKYLALKTLRSNEEDPILPASVHCEPLP